MHVEAKIIDPVADRSDCLVLGVFEKFKVPQDTARLDEASDGALLRLAKRSAFLGKPGQTLMLHALAGLRAQSVLLVGLGAGPDLPAARFVKAANAAAAALAGSGARSAALALSALAVTDRDPYWNVRQSLGALRSALYRFDAMKSKADPPARPLTRARFGVAKAGERDAARLALADADGIADGIDLARDLGNLPANVCTPEYLAQRARDLAKAHPAVRTRVFGETQIRKLGMGALLAVASGSTTPPRFIVMEYRAGARRAAPVVLVGKGVTFDSGGISIKPAASMDEMKFDMCGAASVFGTMLATARLQLPVNLVGLIPATENMPGGSATRPGDIVTSAAGQTIEILNTDAEGRLILCDALNYAANYRPDAVVDIATLTGACVVALGNHASGLFSNDEDLARELLAAAEYSGDRAWQLPLWEDYQEALESNFADVANVGGREAGAITAAAFLARFARELPWAHLDIAGTAWRSGKAKGATGRPVGLLCEYLLAHSGRHATPQP